MFSAIDQIPGEFQIPETQKRKLRKSFALLKSHASAVANFTLQWQDFEDHLLSLHNSIDSKISQLQSEQPATRSEPGHLSCPIRDDNTKEKNASVIPLQSGRDLVDYLNNHLKEHRSIRGELCKLLKGFDGSGRLVLDVMRFFCLSDEKDMKIDPKVVKRSCLLLLEEFMMAGVKVEGDLKEEAKKFADEMKGKVRAGMEYASEVVGFLQLLIAFGIVGEFDTEEILELLESVVQRKQAPDLFRALGFADKAEDFIQRLIEHNKQTEAVIFAFAFELVDKFPPVPLLKDHLKHAKQAAKMICRNGQNSLKAQEDAATNEILSLRAVCRIIENYNLASQYSPEALKKRVKQLRKQRRDMKATAGAPCPKDKPQGPQKQRGKKRNVPASRSQPGQHGGNKRIRTDLSAPHAVNGHTVAPYTSNMIQTSHLLPSGYLAAAGQDSPYLISSVRMRSPPTGAHYVSGPSTSNAYLMQQSRSEPEGLLNDRGTQHLSPVTGRVALARPDSNASLGATFSSYLVQRSHYDQEHLYGSPGFRQLTTSSPVHYSLVASSADASRPNLAADHYGPVSLSSNSHVTRLTVDTYGVDDALVSRYIGSSARRYRSSSGANENYDSTGGTPRPMAIAPSYGSPATVDSLRTPGCHYRQVSYGPDSTSSSQPLSSVHYVDRIRNI